MFMCLYLLCLFNMHINMTKSRKQLEFNKRNKNLCNLQKVFLASGKPDACLNWKEIRLEPTWGFYVFPNPAGQSNLIRLNPIFNAGYTQD